MAHDTYLRCDSSARESHSGRGEDGAGNGSHGWEGPCGSAGR
ncbi:hypothetical protein N9L76_03665 [bacterium]|nr:hypothetical protein [bacterium]